MRLGQRFESARRLSTIRIDKPVSQDQSTSLVIGGASAVPLLYLVTSITSARCRRQLLSRSSSEVSRHGRSARGRARPPAPRSASRPCRTPRGGPASCRPTDSCTHVCSTRRRAPPTPRGRPTRLARRQQPRAARGRRPPVLRAPPPGGHPPS